MREVRACRWCKKDDPNLIKYGTRHYSHSRCLLLNWNPGDLRGAQARERSKAIFDALPIAELGKFQVSNFDREPGMKVMSATGWTMAEFLEYIDQRRAAVSR